jgi:Ca2+-binding RTX toxin-like protein
MPSYSLSGLSWAGSTVTWYYGGDAAYGAEIAQAFARWDAVLALDFQRVSTASAAQISVGFEYIDGPSDTLGVSRSTFNPATDRYTSNSIAFDASENWTWSSNAGTFVLASGVSFYGVALHEIGHSIGLDHTTDDATLLYPFASSSVRDLTASDIAGARLIYGAEAVTVAAAKTVKGTTGNDNGAKALAGDSGNDKLYGYSGNDSLYGAAGNDWLVGGLGRDYMAAGAGSDTFDFNRRIETGNSSTSRDVIADFKTGYDNLDLSTMDANYSKIGNQAFSFIGTQSFHKKAGELHYKVANGIALVEGDVNGDGKADFQIQLNGVSSLSIDDIIL